VYQIPNVGSEDVVRALERAGFRVLRRGSHVTLTNGERQLTFPCREPLRALTTGGIVRDAGLTEEQFRKLLGS
jgi:predicted RNA binding protein YcfA (HicA-like mRNA interferase family)